MLLPSLPRAQAIDTLEKLFGGAFFKNIAKELGDFHRVPETSKRMYTMFWVYRPWAGSVLAVRTGVARVKFEHVTILCIALLLPYPATSTAAGSSRMPPG